MSDAGDDFGTDRSRSCAGGRCRAPARRSRAQRRVARAGTVTRLLGVVLAGGQARRFGRDKALATLAGMALLDHAANALRPVVEEIAVVGRDSSTYVSIADWPATGLGPLGGLCGALRHARDRDFDA